MVSHDDASDEALMLELRAGRREALAPLYRRHAPLVFRLAAQSLDRASAEEIVQEVFFAVWRGADRFDPARGPFRPWMVQIAHYRVLNELRRRSRQPVPDGDDELASAVPDGAPGPAEAVWREQRRAALAAAFGELPEAQRQALGLAFLEDLSHEQVADALAVPLGTAKTRIRTGLQRLRRAPQLAMVALACLLVVVAVRLVREEGTLGRDERALGMLTASDSVNLRLGPAADVPAGTHGRYRGRQGATIAVLTFTNLPALPPGETYRAWVRHGTAWTALGVVEPDAAGSARLVVEHPGLAHLPDAVRLTRDPGDRIVVAWPDA